MYYGQWYHNAGIIVFAVVASHFVTLFGGGFGWLIIVMAVCATYYELSIKRVRRNARDDLAREVAKKGLRTDVESAAWINSFSTFAACQIGSYSQLGQRAWTSQLTSLMPACSAAILAHLRTGPLGHDRERMLSPLREGQSVLTVPFVGPQVASVDQVLQVSTPAFLDSVRTLRYLRPEKSLKLMPLS